MLSIQSCFKIVYSLIFFPFIFAFWLSISKIKLISFLKCWPFVTDWNKRIPLRHQFVLEGRKNVIRRSNLQTSSMDYLFLWYGCYKIQGFYAHPNMNKGTCFYRTLCFTLYLIRVVYISYTELAAGRSSEFVQTVHTDLHHTYTYISYQI